MLDHLDNLQKDLYQDKNTILVTENRLKKMPKTNTLDALDAAMTTILTTNVNML